MFAGNFKIGVLGGGQLGKMLLQQAANYNLSIKILDPDAAAPCKDLAREFVQGSLQDYETVLAFGADCQVVTIEIESVNTEALAELERRGVQVFPQPAQIALIQDKRLQKTFYEQHQIPTAPFVLIDNKAHLLDFLEKNPNHFPCVQKLGKDGYDGRGVQILNHLAEAREKGFDAPSLLEAKADIKTEIAVMVARNPKGETAVFPAVEMVFDPIHNLVDYLLAPAQIEAQLETKARELAQKVADRLGIIGVLAVEMFMTKDNQIWVNEVAPRPHNSGHATIEGNFTSQYEQHLRTLLNLPLGDTALRSPSAMVNLLGAEGHQGKAHYEGMAQILAQKGFYVHLYGKAQTRPWRKMGHVTILAEEAAELAQKVAFVKQHLRVVAQE
ncbi:5-(carboxyamino)imidazole ribonucleotide synthase [Hugenholtzia roseola]|uniref:5-(carboxyamino)imidazole ribonucleotide synthase n=1 Tax=Hugenholtzia roseola TaxID=1002 RepID=UPI00042415D7|nr:5-(carboxyamino)imidazole ribonucleotide synthase [Hugenholtzia roseola]